MKNSIIITETNNLDIAEGTGKNCAFLWKRSPEAVIFLGAWVVFLAYNILDNSAWVALCTTGAFFRVFRILKYVTGLGFGATALINLLKRKYSLKVVIAYAVLGIVTFVSAYFSDCHTYIWYFLIFAAAYRQNARRVVKASLFTTGIMMGAIIAASQTGLAQDYIFDASTRARHGLGFGWTTTAPIMFMFFCFAYIYLRREKMRIWEYLILEAAAVYFYIMTDTQLAFAATSAMLVFMFIEGLFKNRWKFWGRLKWLWISLPVIIFMAVIVLYVVYDRNVKGWAELNSFLHGRLTLGQNGIRDYGFTIFGQPIAWRGFYIFATVVPDYNYIDCSYLQILLQLGGAFIAAVLAIYTAAMKKAVSAKDQYLVWTLAGVLLFSIMEPRLMNMSFNMFPLMAFMDVDVQKQE